MPARRQSLPEIAFHAYAYARACGTSGNWQDASPEWKAVFTAIANDIAREICRRVAETETVGCPRDRGSGSFDPSAQESGA